MQIAKLSPVTRYKQVQRAKGKAQVQLWLPEDVRDMIDAFVEREGVKNRSEAVQKLIQETISRKGSMA